MQLKVMIIEARCLHSQIFSSSILTNTAIRSTDIGTTIVCPNTVTHSNDTSANVTSGNVTSGNVSTSRKWVLVVGENASCEALSAAFADWTVLMVDIGNGRPRYDINSSYNGQS